MRKQLRGIAKLLIKRDEAFRKITPKLLFGIAKLPIKDWK